MNESEYDELHDYVLGLSDDTQAKRVEQRLKESAALRQEAAVLYETLTNQAADLPTAEPSKSLLTSIVDTVRGENPFAGFVDRLADFLDLDRARVKSILNKSRHNETQWVPSGMPGITYLNVEPGPARADHECQLVRMEPHSRFPLHGHKSDEWGFVIQGEVREDSGEIYRPGDIVFKDQTSHHSFVASGDQPFLFFVIHGGLEFDMNPS